MNWEQVQTNMDKQTLTPEELEVKKINAAYIKLRSAMNILTQLHKEFAKVTGEAEIALNELNKILEESSKKFPSPQQQLYRDTMNAFAKGKLKGESNEPVENE